MICLDSNVVIMTINRRPSGMRARIESELARGMAVALPTLVLFELHYGITRSARPVVNRAALAEIMELDLIVWPFEAEDAAEAGEIRAGLERAGTPIGPYDALIAAQARRRDALLVTANTREFARVPGLRVEDWAAG